MNEKEVLAAIDKALTPLQSLNGHLKVIVLMQLAGEFYTKTQRRELYSVYEKLRAEDTRLYANLQATQDELIDRGIGYEERVKRYGEKEAEKQMAPIVAAMDARREHGGEINAFRREHAIIYELIRAKEILESV